MSPVRSAAFLLLCLAGAAPAAAQTSTDASFGTWPFLVGNMDPQIPTLVARAVSNDLDTIYVNVFRTTGPSRGTLWISDRAGTWNPAWGPVRTNGVGIDLKNLVGQAHAANLQVVGVVKCFDDTVQPTDPAHRAYLRSVCDYLLNSFDASGAPVYDLDGLALDYIRFVGTSCNNDPRYVNDVLADVRGLLGARTLHAYVLANRYTFDGPVYNSQFNSYGSVISSFSTCYGQHWEQMAQWVDVMMPMAYTANGSIYSTYAQHQAYVSQVASYCRTAVQRGGYPARRIVPAIRTYSDGNETATTQTIAASITGALGGGGNGYNAFRYGTMQSSWWPVLAQYAAPGPDRPIPGLVVAASGLTIQADAASSRSAKQAAASLAVRYDLDNDGSFETGWIVNAPSTLLARQPGASRVGVQVRDTSGHVGASVRSYAAQGAPLSATAFLSASAGGAVSLPLVAGPGAAGASYLVLGSLSGSTPGTPVGGGLVVPLNIDGVTAGLLGVLNTPVFQQAFGNLDAQGRATATLQAPAGVLGSLLFRPITWAAFGADATGAPVFVTNAAVTVVTP